MFDLFGYATSVALLVYPLIFLALWFAMKGVRSYIKNVSNDRYDFTALTLLENKVLSKMNSHGDKTPRPFLIFTMVAIVFEITLLVVFGAFFLINAAEINMPFTLWLMDLVHCVAKMIAPVMGWVISVLGSLYAFHLVASIAIKAKMRLDDVHAATETVLKQADEINGKKAE